VEAWWRSRRAFTVTRQVRVSRRALWTFPLHEFVDIRGSADGHAPSVLGDMRRNPSRGRTGVASPVPSDHPRSELLCIPTSSPENPSVLPVQVDQAPFENSRSPLPILLPEPSRPSIRPDLTKRQVAESLGVSIRTLENWVRRKQFTPWKCGRVVRFDPSEVEQFRRRHRLSGPVPTTPAFHRRRRNRRIALPEGFGAAEGNDHGCRDVVA
jgi:excisionase family DNA binding protein